VSTVNVDTSQLRGASLPPGGFPALLKLLGESAIGMMLARTAQGVDVNGAAFLPYTEAYTRWKASHGIKGQKLKGGYTKKGTLRGRSPMSAGDWLRDTGAMLKSLQVVRNDGTVLDIECIGDRAGDPINNDTLAEYVDAPRPWLGLNEAEVEEIGEIAEAWLVDHFQP
jgi:hypothetical protein